MNYEPAPLRLLEQQSYLAEGERHRRSRMEAISRKPSGIIHRPRVHGKFLFVGDEKFWVRGVTYGTFRPDSAGVQFPTPTIVEDDFQAMVSAGVNAVRVYTVPPRWLLDLAACCGLRVMVGLPWEQHVSFLDNRAGARRIVSSVRDGIRRCADHPAVLCYAIGNEIPASVVRWYGKRRIETFLAELSMTAKRDDPGALVTYVNFPTTEYLDLPFIDFVSFNVYLESIENFSSYLARLQNLSGERPLLMAEVGLDSRRNGEAAQAHSLDWQIAKTFEWGCTGVFVFAWTDEWFRGGHDIKDWDFGLTTRDRRSKPALATVSDRFSTIPVPTNLPWPKVSVIVCSCNGAATIGETLAELERLDYPDYEVIVVDDGSTDDTSAIAGKHNVRLIRTDNNGLSSARNSGLQAATGEIVAYIDDDAYPDPHWLTFLAAGFMRADHAGIGGPNLAPPGDGAIADCVANAPGGPVHVLLSDEIAEHIPGCNMAYRRDRLIAIEGFDPRFRVAGDDVDVCWRLQELGWTLGFVPTALVWHHRRCSVRSYFAQQVGYAKAEALLQEKWPRQFNSVGHLTWHGRLYGRGLLEGLFRTTRIYHGVFGSAPFQSIYECAPNVLATLPLMPEWYLLLLGLGGIVLLGFSWPPLLWLAPLLVGGLGLTAIQAAKGGKRASFHPEPRSGFHRLGLQSVVAWFHLLQPAARLFGRVKGGLGPLQRRRLTRTATAPRVQSFWCEEWQTNAARLTEIEQCIHGLGAISSRAGDFDGWDLEIRSGFFGGVRSVAMVEEHGAGKQLFRLRAWPRVPGFAVGVLLALCLLAGLAARDGAKVAAFSFALGAGFIAFAAYADCATAMKVWQKALTEYVRRRAVTPIVDG